MQLSDFDYDLPPERIAQTPIEPRDSARLLVDHGDAPPEHRHVRDLAQLLRPGDLLVLNDTKVFPARLNGTKSSGGRVEVLLLESFSEAARSLWIACWLRPISGSIGRVTGWTSCALPRLSGTIGIKRSRGRGSTEIT